MNKLYKKRTFQLFAAFIITIFITFMLVSIGYHGAKNIVDQKNDSIFEKSVRLFILEKMKGDYSCGFMENDPKKMGTYETKTCRDKDTTFTFRSKIVDYETDLYRVSLDCYLEMDSIHATDLKKAFDNKCRENGIFHTRSAVKIHADSIKHYNDSTGIIHSTDYDYKIVLPKQGIFEEITLTAYLACSPLTYWGLMPHTGIYIWGSTSLLIALLLLLYILRLRYEKRIGTEILKNGDFRIFHTIINHEERTYINTHTHVTGKVPPQMMQVLVLFLTSEKNEVTTERLVAELWPKRTPDEAITNRTTTIRRVNELLTEMGCKQMIIGDEKRGVYRLK